MRWVDDGYASYTKGCGMTFFARCRALPVLLCFPALVAYATYGLAKTVAEPLPVHQDGTFDQASRAGCVGPHLPPFLVNHDGTFEHGYHWLCQDGEIGAFAEGFRGPGIVCGVQFSLCCPWWILTDSVTVFVWDAEDGHPGDVLAMVASTTENYTNCQDTAPPDATEIYAEVGEEFFVGTLQHSWDFPLRVLADLDGPGTGDQSWVHLPDVGWRQANDLCADSVHALSIGVSMEATPSPSTRTTWGAVKNRFRE